ncbi:hypothetical protein [Flavobacterium ginsengiterrae]
MRNLFLIGCMLFSFSYASAQETPQKKRSTTKTDTVHKQNTSRSKTDTVNKQRTEKKKGMSKSTNKQTTAPRKDSINGTRP